MEIQPPRGNRRSGMEDDSYNINSTLSSAIRQQEQNRTAGSFKNLLTLMYSHSTMPYHLRKGGDK